MLYSKDIFLFRKYYFINLVKSVLISYNIIFFFFVFSLYKDNFYKIRMLSKKFGVKFLLLNSDIFSNLFTPKLTFGFSNVLLVADNDVNKLLKFIDLYINNDDKLNVFAFMFKSHFGFINDVKEFSSYSSMDKIYLLFLNFINSFLSYPFMLNGLLSNKI